MMDLYAAHRAEALEVLAGIELKVALAWKAVHVEKVEVSGMKRRWLF